MSDLTDRNGRTRMMPLPIYGNGLWVNVCNGCGAMIADVDTHERVCAAHDGPKRLSVILAEEHVKDGHGGKYSPYCYRCQHFGDTERGQQDRDGQPGSRRP